MRWHMAKRILLIALVLSKWPLTADTQIQEPSSLAGKPLSDSEYKSFFQNLGLHQIRANCSMRALFGGQSPLTQAQLLDWYENHRVIPKGRVCSDWPISALFPDFCAFAFYRCILKKYFLKKFRCPGVTTQKTADTQTTNQEAVPEANVFSMLQSVAERHDTLATAATTTESLPVLLTAISTSAIANAEVSPELSPTNTAMTATIEASDTLITPVTTTAQSLLEHHAVNTLEPLPELPTVPDAVVTPEPVPELLLATPATTTAVLITSLDDSTTAESSSESLATTSTTESFSRLTIIFTPIDATSPTPFVSSPTHHKKAKAGDGVGITSPQQNSVMSANTQQHEESPKPSKETLTAGHWESQVSLVTLNGQPQKETPTAQQAPLPDINLRDLFLRLQDGQVQHLIQEAQDVLAKGKGKQKQDLQATSLQLLRALNIANRQQKAKIKSQEQASNRTQF